MPSRPDRREHIHTLEIVLMNTRFTATILFMVLCAADARADRFAPWATMLRPAPGSAALASDANRGRFDGYGPWVDVRA